MEELEKIAGKYGVGLAMIRFEYDKALEKHRNPIISRYLAEMRFRYEAKIQKRRLSGNGINFPIDVNVEYG